MQHDSDEANTEFPSFTLARLNQLAIFGAECSQEELDGAERVLNHHLGLIKKVLSTEVRQSHRNALRHQGIEFRLLLERIQNRQESRQVLPDGTIVEARGGVVVDDAYLEAEERHAQEQRAAVIAKYGSMEAYDEHMRAETRRARRQRREIMGRMRMDRVRAKQLERSRDCTHQPRTRTREYRPGATRRAASSSTTSAQDPGDSDSDADPWPGGFTFRAYNQLVSLALPGHVRARLFNALPEQWQREAWDALSREMDRRVA
jgi:hypothetical protein